MAATISRKCSNHESISNTNTIVAVVVALSFATSAGWHGRPAPVRNGTNINFLIMQTINLMIMQTWLKFVSHGLRDCAYARDSNGLGVCFGISVMTTTTAAILIGGIEMAPAYAKYAARISSGSL